jgi:hypothetical protein
VITYLHAFAGDTQGLIAGHLHESFILTTSDFAHDGDARIFARLTFAHDSKIVLIIAMSAPKGFRPPAAGKGRPRGSKNRLGLEAKEAIALAFQGIGGVPALTAWAATHREAFYKLYAKLIPVELHGSSPNGGIQVVISAAEAAL